MIPFWEYEQKLLDETMKVTPGGSQTRSKGPGKVGPVDTEKLFPLYAQRGVGHKVVCGDPNGEVREYVDLFGANAAIPLGYAFPPVVEAVSKAVRDGNLLSLPSRLEVQVSEKFLHVCAPWATRVRWVKTGTEAVMAAVRLARAKTGRSNIVVMDSSYHGWSDLNDARHNQCEDVSANGVPPQTAKLTSVMPYHDTALNYYINDTVAAVLVEPHRWIKTDASWLAELMSRARQVGVLVIFDEMVYGLRWAKGGSTEFLGGADWWRGSLRPDMACFGKALGNGVPVACVCGLLGTMDNARQYISGTYFGETIGLAAADAVLDTYAGRDVVTDLWINGRNFWGGFTTTPGAMKAHLEGTFVHWRLGGLTPEQMDAVQVQAIDEGLLFHRDSNNASAAMTPAEAFRYGEHLGQVVGSVVQ